MEIWFFIYALISAKSVKVLPGTFDIFRVKFHTIDRIGHTNKRFFSLAEHLEAYIHSGWSPRKGPNEQEYLSHDMTYA